MFYIFTDNFKIKNNLQKMKAFWIFAEVNSWKGMDLGLIKTIFFFWHLKIWSQTKIDWQTLVQENGNQ